MKAAKYISGVTIVELLITVAIIAIISAIAIPAFVGYIKTGRINECQQEMLSLALAQEEFFLEQRTFFLGDSSGAGTAKTSLQTNSLELWKPAEPDNNIRNCMYTAIAGSTGDIASSYLMTAVGKVDLTGEGVLVSKSR